MDEDSTEVVRVLLDAVVESLDLLLVKEAQDVLFQLSASLAGNDLNEAYSLLDGLIDDLVQRAIDVPATVVDVMKIEFQLHEGCCGSVVSRATNEALVRVPACFD